MLIKYIITSKESEQQLNFFFDNKEEWKYFTKHFQKYMRFASINELVECSAGHIDKDGKTAWVKGSEEALKDVLFVLNILKRTKEAPIPEAILFTPPEICSAHTECGLKL